MPRSYRFEHFTTAKPDVSKQKRGSERLRHTPLKSELPPPAEEPLHYGHQHAQTQELYRQRRMEHELEVGVPAARPREEPRVAEETAVPGIGAGRREPAPELEAERLEPTPVLGVERREPTPEGLDLKELARQAVATVLQAARETATGKPLRGAKTLAGGTVTGARKVAREVSARASRQLSEWEAGPAPKKGKGRKKR